MGIKRIRAVSRAIEVLRSLQRSPGQTLADLHKSTRLPKATLERILATLDDEQVVWRAMADGGYRHTLHFQHRDRAYMKNHHLAEIAMPHLEALRKRTIWPSDLAVRHGYAMVLLETTRSRAGLGLFRDQIGQPINMPYSAVGRAYLAFCPERERTMLIRHAFKASRGLGMPAAAEGAQAVLENCSRPQERSDTRYATLYSPDGAGLRRLPKTTWRQ
jgi:IclR family transcriptional regulator, mhp operon transcriptional activator